MRAERRQTRGTASFAKFWNEPAGHLFDVIDWVESIPVAETRNYVQRVLENLQIYRLRLGETTLAFTLASDLKR